MNVDDRQAVRATVYGAGPSPDRTILRAVAETAGGYTLCPTGGGWIDGDGRLVTEAGWRLEIIDTDRVEVRTAATDVAGWALDGGESAVLMTWEDADGLRRMIYTLEV